MKQKLKMYVVRVICAAPSAVIVDAWMRGADSLLCGYVVWALSVA